MISSASQPLSPSLPNILQLLSCACVPSCFVLSMSDRIDQSSFFQSNIEINEIRSKRDYPACAWGEGKEVPKRRSNWSRDRPFSSFRRHIGEIRWRAEQSTWLIWRKVGFKNLEIRPAGKWSKILCNLKRVSKRRLQSQNSRRFYALGHCQNLIVALEVHYENLCVRLGIYLPDYLLKLFLPPTQYIRSSKSSALCHNFVIRRSQNSIMAISGGGGTPT